MSALLNITNIVVKNNPTTFNGQFLFDVTCEVMKPIPKEIQWQLIYIGSSKDEKYDQLLENFCMGPFEEVGAFTFAIQAQGPDHTKIPSKDDLMGVSAIILVVKYEEKEFFRCGYYVSNLYTDPYLIENDTPDAPVQLEKIVRTVQNEKPRITRFNIWEEHEQKAVKEQELRNQMFAQDVQPGVLSDCTNTNPQMQVQQNMPFGNPFCKSNGIFEQLNQQQGGAYFNNSSYSTFQQGGALDNPFMQQQQQTPFMQQPQQVPFMSQPQQDILGLNSFNPNSMMQQQQQQQQFQQFQ